MLSLIAALALTPVTVTVQTPNPEGVIYVQLCDSATFMREGCPHQQRREAAAELQFVFETVEPGEWAIMVWRDPDSDGQMRRGMWGQPLEPTAISNNPPARFGPPIFEDAKVTVGEEPFAFTLSVR